eukprot:CAMPEP_0194311682 /NCGR_PEP_ID=MMETSP0171-20130528/8612_1 /TAXON_ID=218684 /ORGANISM="Corethron pennatum, Strain L29A3" /LENGTH=54 /DNA_ID=CAMNT_0039065851 /DNA_START=443 /DNA_END=603 /DNA_ORIENTATION=+
MKFCYSIVLALVTATAVTGDKHDTRNLRGSGLGYGRDGQDDPDVEPQSRRKLIG